MIKTGVQPEFIFEILAGVFDQNSAASRIARVQGKPMEFDVTGASSRFADKPKWPRNGLTTKMRHQRVGILREDTLRYAAHGRTRSTC